MKGISTVKLLLMFTVTFSLVGLSGPLAALFQLPSLNIPLAHAANLANSYGAWYPAGAQEQTLSISTFDGATATQYNALVANQIDAMDWPLTASQQLSIPCPTGSGGGTQTINCSQPVADHGYFEIQFNLGQLLWGVNQQFGESAAGVQLRQAIAHLIDKSNFAATNAACQGIVCTPDDQAIPVCTNTLTPGCTNGGLISPNPCSWDQTFPQTGTNCAVGAPGGTPYGCNATNALATCPSPLTTSCPNNTLCQFSWQRPIGSPDFCAAATHFVQAFADSAAQGGLGITVTKDPTTCELVPPAGGWPAAVTATMSTCTGQVSTADVCLIARQTEPRLDLGRGLTQELCALFAGGTATSLNGLSFSGCAPYVQEVELNPGAICAFTTPDTGTTNNNNPCWSLLTAGFIQVFPFDSTTYFEYNSNFVSQTGVSCTNVTCTTTAVSGNCASTAATTSAPDYMYVCSPTYDTLSHNMEFATCLNVANDPQASTGTTPSFYDCSGTLISSGVGSTSCTVAACTAVSAGYQAEDYYGSHVLTLPIWANIDRIGINSAWTAGDSNAPGIADTFGAGYAYTSNFWDWLNAYSASPFTPGTFRQGFLTQATSLSPFQATFFWDFEVLNNIYDSLFNQNPLCNLVSPSPSIQACPTGVTYQNLDWMTTDHHFLCNNAGATQCTVTNVGYTVPPGTNAVLTLSLSQANHWQDEPSAGTVSSWDIKYTMLNLNATGAFQASSLANLSGVQVRDSTHLDLDLKAKGPFTELFVGGITIIPGHLWSQCGAQTWNSAVNLGSRNVVGTSLVNAAEDNCVGTFNGFLPGTATLACPGSSVHNLATNPIGCIGNTGATPPTGVPPNQSYADAAFDPILNRFLIGSGPYSCSNTGINAGVAVGTIGTGCSSDGTQIPATGLGTYTLTRTGCVIQAAGTSCVAPAGTGTFGGISVSDYFRSSGALATYTWSGDVGIGNSDRITSARISSCLTSTPFAGCPHWNQGIGVPGTKGVATANQLRIGIAKVKAFIGVKWIGYSTPISNPQGTQAIPTCGANYTLPGGTVTPCTAANAGWQSSIMPGIGGWAATLYEVGSSHPTLSPAGTSPFANCAGPVGTATFGYNATTAGNIGGYDC